MKTKPERKASSARAFTGLERRVMSASECPQEIVVTTYLVRRHGQPLEIVGCQRAFLIRAAEGVVGIAESSPPIRLAPSFEFIEHAESLPDIKLDCGRASSGETMGAFILARLGRAGRQPNRPTIDDTDLSMTRRRSPERSGAMLRGGARRADAGAVIAD
jgi:hypothetical protein